MKRRIIYVEKEEKHISPGRFKSGDTYLEKICKQRRNDKNPEPGNKNQAEKIKPVHLSPQKKAKDAPKRDRLF